MKTKLQSFKSELSSTDASIFTAQETHYKKKGTLKLPEFEIFESIRSKPKGGTIIGIHKALNPMLINVYEKDFELLVVEFEVAKRQIRIISGYGPQETWSESDRLPFFLALEAEINKAEMENKSVIIQMDANSKLGAQLIKDDPHDQTPNGKLLHGIIERHGLVLVNGLQDKCEGAITRRRVTKNSVEESIIDFVIVSPDLEQELKSLVVDESRKHVLTKITNTKKGIRKQESDHNVLISKFQFSWSKNIKRARIEMFNLKNRDCQVTCKENTSNTDILSSIFEKNSDINICTKKFLKRLNGCIQESFRKVRIGQNKNNDEVDDLFDKRRLLKNKSDDESREELKK